MFVPCVCVVCCLRIVVCWLLRVARGLWIDVCWLLRVARGRCLLFVVIVCC